MTSVEYDNDIGPELFAELHGVTLCYGLSGPADGQPMVLISGHGEQMIGWVPGFRALLEAEGFRLIRFDNRDVGRSTRFETADPDAPYTFEDMAADVDQLIGYLGYESVHVVGRSMGGMIAQQLALSFPQRVRSLCCMYSIPSLSFLVDDPEVQEFMSRPQATDRAGVIRQYVERKELFGGGFGETWLAEYAGRVYDRGFYPEGAARHSAAFARQGDRLPELERLRVPAAMIHGRDDRLLSFEGSVAIASAIPDAEIHVYAGMAHDLQPDLWQDFVRVIARNAARAGNGGLDLDT